MQNCKFLYLFDLNVYNKYYRWDEENISKYKILGKDGGFMTDLWCIYIITALNRFNLDDFKIRNAVCNTEIKQIHIIEFNRGNY